MYLVCIYHISCRAMFMIIECKLDLQDSCRATTLWRVSVCTMLNAWWSDNRDPLILTSNLIIYQHKNRKFRYSDAGVLGIRKYHCYVYIIFKILFWVLQRGSSITSKKLFSTTHWYYTSKYVSATTLYMNSSGHHL